MWEKLNPVLRFAQYAANTLFQSTSTCTKRQKECSAHTHVIERQAETVENTTETIQSQTNNGLCRRCGRKLKDPISIERGFGEICYQKHMSELRVGRGLFTVTHKEAQEDGK